MSMAIQLTQSQIIEMQTKFALETDNPNYVTLP